MKHKSLISVIASVTRFLSFVLISLALVIALLVIGQRIFNPFQIVASGSMSPQIKAGDAVIVKDIKARDVRAGQVIIFRDPADRDALIIHRVIAVKGTRSAPIFLTKGDNNPAGDTRRVSTRDLVGGVAVNIPRFGSFMELITSPRGYIACAAIPGAVALSLVFLLAVGETADKRDSRGLQGV